MKEEIKFQLLDTLGIHGFNSINLVLTYFVHLVTGSEYPYRHLRLSQILLL